MLYGVPALQYCNTRYYHTRSTSTGTCIILGGEVNDGTLNGIGCGIGDCNLTIQRTPVGSLNLHWLSWSSHNFLIPFFTRTVESIKQIEEGAQLSCSIVVDCSWIFGMWVGMRIDSTDAMYSSLWFSTSLHHLPKAWPKLRRAPRSVQRRGRKLVEVQLT